MSETMDQRTRMTTSETTTREPLPTGVADEALQPDGPSRLARLLSARVRLVAG